jgi:hypothetical protein
MHGEIHAAGSGEKDFDFDASIRAFCKRKYMSDFAREMNRSVGEYLKNFGDYVSFETPI